MKRRTLLISIGGAAGTAGVIGTGAFTSVEADRDVSVTVANEENAYLGIEPSPSSSANSEFATQDSSNGDQIALNFDDSGNSGSGVGLSSVYDFDDVFRITNQGTQTIYVWANFSGGDLSDDDIWFYPDGESSRKLNDGDNSVVTVPVGETVKMGVHIDTNVLESEDGDQTLTATLTADVDVPTDSNPSDGVGEDAAVVSKNPDDGEYSSIQSAIDAVDGTTVLVESGTYEESVTIDVEGLTLKAAGDASPTIDASGINGGSIPVLVDDADGVTVDDENIEFLSGIDVGVDFSDYEPGITETDADAIVTGDAAETDEFNSIGAALDQKGADTTVLVKSDYDASNENSNNDGSNSALISIVHKNVEVISQEGPTKTVIDERPDATGGGRAVDINAANVVFKGFDVSNAAQEGIVVTGVENAKGIEITDNKVTSDTDGILVSEYGPEGFDSASTDGIVIENNEINHKRFGVSLSNGATEPVVKHNTIIGNGNERGIALNRDGEGVTNATVEANLVETSYVGFQRNDDGSTVESLSNNHFINNDLLAIANSASGQLDATENFFGTEDRQTIQDEKISGSGGDTVFDPFAAVEIDPDAGK